MIKADNVVRGVRIPVLLLMAVSLVACGGDSAIESSDSGLYTVGGSVTGVTSGGMLAISNHVNKQLNHQKNRMSLRANTTYVFSRTVASGDTYQVVVEDDPLNQRCTVSNGAGLAVGNVSNVNIHCVTPPKYSVGGSVTGLNGMLVLKINGGEEEVTLFADSAYTFPTSIMSGTDYQVSIYNEPANQDCTITNASGTLSSPVTNISVSCTSDSWIHPAHLAVNISPDGENAINPQIAMDDSGNVIVVWQQFDGAPFPSNELPKTQIYMSDYNITLLDAWTHPLDLTDHISVAGESAINPQVAMGRNPATGSDDAVIVWSQKDGRFDDRSQLFMSEYRAGSWSHPLDLSSASYINPTGLGSFIYDNPRVAMDDLGNAIIAWTQFSGVGETVDSPQLYVSEYRGGSWTHPASRKDDTFSQTGRPVQFAPDVAMANNGDAVVVWRQHTASSKGALAHRREYRDDGLGTWSWSAVPSPDLLNDPRLPFSANDTISPTKSGNYSGIKVAMDDSGNTIIVWDQNIVEAQPHPYYPGASSVNISHVFKSEYRGGVWSAPVTQSDHISPAGLSVQSPNVVMNNSDEAIITWQQRDDISREQRIFKSEYRANAWTHPQNLADNISLGGDGVAHHDVALADNGDALIVWRQFDGFKYSAYKSEYRVSVAEWRHPIGVADAISSEISVPTDCDSTRAGCLPASVHSGPVVAMDNSVTPGDALILWSQSDAESTPASGQIVKSELRY